MVCGATAIMMPVFDPVKTLEMTQKYRATVFAGVPTMYHMVFNVKNFNSYDLSSVRLVIIGGAPAMPVLLEAMKKIFQSLNL